MEPSPCPCPFPSNSLLGPESAELCLLPFHSWSLCSFPGLRCLPSFSAFPLSEAVAIVPLPLYHSISLSLPAGDSAKCLALFRSSKESNGGWGWKTLLRREGA